MDRKNFLKSASLLFAGSLLADANAQNVILPKKIASNKLKKGLGFGMIREDLSILDKFKLVKDLGFDGIEFNSPVDFSIHELKEASAKTGIIIPSVVNKDHWSLPLSDPNPEVRSKIISSIAQSLEDVKELGGDTVLVVPGVVNDHVSYQTAYKNALESIKKLIPFVEKTGMKIGLENVWNNFILSPIEAREFVDQINHPLVGWYFDIGNVMRYGWPEHWIEILGERIVKLHAKEFSKDKMQHEGLGRGFAVELTEGSINWQKVMQSIRDIDYKGEWLTLEVGGGDRNHLLKLSKQLDKIISY